MSEKKNSKPLPNGGNGSTRAESKKSFLPVTSHQPLLGNEKSQILHSERIAEFKAKFTTPVATNQPTPTEKARTQVPPPAKKLPPERIREVSAADILDDYVKNVISEGGFIDAEDISENLHSCINLKLVSNFRFIQDMNKKINAVVDVYWHSNAIRSFFEMEDLLKQQIVAYKKISPAPIDFDDLGYGSLLRHKKVMQLFKFPRNILRNTLLNLSTKAVIKLIFEGLEQQRYYTWSDEVELFISSLLAAYFQSLEKLQSVYVNEKEIFHAWKNLHRSKFSKEVREFSGEFERLCRAQLQKSFNALLEERKSSISQLFEKCEIFSAKQLSLCSSILDFFIKEITKCETFETTSYHLFSKFFNIDVLDTNSKSVVIASSSAVFELLSETSKSILRGCSPKKANKSNDLFACKNGGFRNLCATAATCLLFLIPEFSNVNQDMSLEQTLFHRNIFSGVPKFMSNLLFNFLLDQTNVSSIGSVCAAPDSTESKQLILEETKLTKTFDLIFGALQKLSNSHAAVIMVTASIVYFRLKWAIQPSLSTPSLSDIQGEIIRSLSEPMMKDSSHTVEAFISTLSDVETSMKCKLKLPAMELVNQGSFLNIINKSKNVKIWELLEALIRTKDDVKEPNELKETQNDIVITDLTGAQIMEVGNLLHDNLHLFSNDRDLVETLIHLNELVNRHFDNHIHVNLLSYLPRLMNADQNLVDAIHSICGMQPDVLIGNEGKSTCENDSHEISMPIEEIKKQLPLARFVVYSILCGACCPAEIVDFFPQVPYEVLLQYYAQWYLVKNCLFPISVSRQFVEDLVNEYLLYDDTTRSYSLQTSSLFPSLIHFAPQDVIIAQAKHFINEQLEANSSRNVHIRLDLQVNVIVWQEKFIASALTAIANVPFGESCRIYSCWDAFFGQLLAADGSEVSIVNFVLQEAAKFDNTMKFEIVMKGSYVDFVRLPAVIPEYDTLYSLWQNCELKILASLCASHTVRKGMDIVWSDNFGMLMRSVIIELYERRGIDALTSLLDEILVLCRWQESYMDSAYTFLEFTRCLSAKAKQQSLEKQAWELTSTRLSQFEIRSYLTRLGLRMSPRFPILFKLGNAYLQSNVVNPSASTITSFSSDENVQMLSNANIQIQRDQILIKQELNSEETTNDTSNALIVGTGQDLNTTSYERAATSCDSSIESQRHMFIRNLLKSKFHYDEHGFRPPKESPEAEDLKNSLELLSASLYSSDMHFVMELLQNADDNTYNKETFPTIKFELFPHTLNIYNNEMGFQENNVVAICKVGGSTKKDQVGYIGQKGIGFKSVFSISDRPEIHSNGFHIMFDNDISKLEPVWLEDNDKNPKACGRWPLKTVDATYFETCVRLLLRNNIRKSLGTLIEQMEEVFDGKLLLFLKKLNRMIFDNHSNATIASGRIEHIREYINVHWTSIESKWENCSHLLADTAALVSSTSNSSLVHTKHYWWTVRKTLIDPVILRQNVKLDSSEIILVFRFVSSSSSERVTHLQMEIKDDLFPVYAYLPTQAPCFHFMLQADFVLATSRESVLDNNDWNRMLLREVPTVFVDAIKELAACVLYGHAKDKHSRENFARLCPRLSSIINCHGDDNSLPYVHVSTMNLLSLIPRESQLTSALKNTAKEIYILLQDVEFLPNAHGTMSSPKEILYTGDLPADILSFIPGSLIFNALGKHALRAQDGERDNCYLDKDLIVKLQIETFGFTHLIKIFEHFYATTNRKSPSYIQTFTRLLLATYLLVKSQEKSGLSFKQQQNPFIPAQVTLSSHNKTIVNNHNSSGSFKKDKPSRDYLAKLKDIPMWPLKDGRCVSIADHVVIIETDTKNTLSDREKACLEYFKDDIAILCDAIFAEADEMQKHLISHKKGEVGVNVKFSADLASFLLQYFPRSKFDFKLDNSTIYGGFSNLTKSMIEETVILPVYRNWKLDTPLSNVTRHKMAAYLAFLCSNGSLLLFRDTGYLIPVLSAKDSNSHDGSWGQARVVRSNDLQGMDIHFGVEFEDSATFQLLEFITAMRQLNWTVVDPLVTGFLLNVKGLLTPAGHEDTLKYFRVKSSAISQAFKNSNLSIQGSYSNNNYNTSNIVRFLRDIGVVNFFGLKMENIEKLSNESSLFSFLGHIFRNGKRVKMCHNVEGNQKLEKNDFVPISLPIFQPEWQQNTEREYSSDLLMVSEEVYEFMMRVVPLVVNELMTHQSNLKSADTIQCIIKQLNSQPWFPVEHHPEMMKEIVQYSTHPEVLDNLKAGKLYLLATTPNIIYHESKQQQFILGAHALYCPAKLVSSLHHHRIHSQHNYHRHQQNYNSSNFLDIFPFARLSNDIPAVLLMEQLEWMMYMQEQQATEDVWCFEKIERIAHLYETLFIEIRDNPNSSLLMRMEGHMKTDRPMIFIPSPLYNEDDKGIYVKGSMYKLSSLIKKDPTKLLLNDAPIKNISKYYSKEISKTPLFCRNWYCSVCQASEGIFGVRGLSMQESNRFSKVCTCDITGFDSVLRSLPGLIASSLSMEQMLTLLKHHRDRGFATQHMNNEYFVSSAKDNRGHFRIILNSIASGIWKCFHIKNALHPYSADNLKLLINVLESEPLIPILAQAKSLSSQMFAQFYEDELHNLVISKPPEGKSFLAIDDITIYETFSSIVQAKDWDRMIFVDAGWSGDDDGHHTKGPELIVRQFFTAERLDGLANVPYNLKIFREENKAFLASESFFTSASNLPIATFFAPKNILPLLKLVEIPMISEKIEQTISKEMRMLIKPREISISQRFMLVFNRLLTIAQAKWAAHNVNYEFRVDALAQSSRLKRLFHTRLFNCDMIQRHVQLSMFHEDYSAVIADDVHLILANPDPTTNWPAHYEVYLQNDISAESIHTIAITMIMEVLRIEIASLMTNQLFDFVGELEKILRKYAKSVAENDTTWNLMLRHDELDNIVQSYENRNALWKLKLPLTETVEEEVNDTSAVNMNQTEGKDQGEMKEHYEEPAELDEEEKNRRKRALEAAQRRKMNDEQRRKELLEKNNAEKMKKIEVEVSLLASSNKQEAKVDDNQTKAPAISNVSTDQDTTEDETVASDGPKLIVRYDIDTVSSLKIAKKAKNNKGDPGANTNEAEQVKEKYTSRDIIEKVVVHGESIVMVDDAQPSAMDMNGTNKGKEVVYEVSPVHISLSSSDQPQIPPVSQAWVPYKWKMLPNTGTDTATNTDNNNYNENDTNNNNGNISTLSHLVSNLNFNQSLARDTAGGMSGQGRWQEHFLHNNQHLSHSHQDNCSVTSVQVPEVIIQACVEQHLHANADYQSLVSSNTTSDAYPLPEIGSKLTGRMGEQIAYQYFTANAPSESRVIWENENEEQGFPYDIRLIYPSGEEKKVEVKTRSVNGMQAPPTLWRISPAEIHAAYQYQEHYFCVLVSLRVDYKAHGIGLNSLLTVGKEHGLIRSLKDDRQAYLLLKIPNMIIIPNNKMRNNCSNDLEDED